MFRRATEYTRRHRDNTFSVFTLGTADLHTTGLHVGDEITIGCISFRWRSVITLIRYMAWFTAIRYCWHILRHGQDPLPVTYKITKIDYATRTVTFE